MSELRTEAGTRLRDWDDIDTLRDDIFEKSKNEVTRAFPMSYHGLRLEAQDIDYVDPPMYNRQRQKEAILNDDFLHRRLRGKLRLIDEETGDVLDEDTKTLARVPWLSDRGTFVHGGNEYTISHQNRILPGPYSRIKENQELETWFNVKRGTGSSFKVRFEPESSLFKVDIGGSSLRMYPILRALGYTDDDLVEHWGEDVLSRNKSTDTRPIDTFYHKLNRYADQDIPHEEKIEAIRGALNKVSVNRRVASRNLPVITQREEQHAE